MTALELLPWIIKSWVFNNFQRMSKKKDFWPKFEFIRSRYTESNCCLESKWCIHDEFRNTAEKVVKRKRSLETSALARGICLLETYKIFDSPVPDDVSLLWWTEGKKKIWKYLVKILRLELFDEWNSGEIRIFLSISVFIEMEKNPSLIGCRNSRKYRGKNLYRFWGFERNGNPKLVPSFGKTKLRSSKKRVWGRSFGIRTNGTPWLKLPSSNFFFLDNF